MASLPDVDALRNIYLAARRLGTRPVSRMTLADLERDVARAGNLTEGPATQAGLAVLARMGLVELDPEQARMSVPAGRKGNPADDALFARLRLIHDYAAEKGVI
jgi:hypothetical protein